MSIKAISVFQAFTVRNCNKLNIKEKQKKTLFLVLLCPAHMLKMSFFFVLVERWQCATKTKNTRGTVITPKGTQEGSDPKEIHSLFLVGPSRCH